MSETINPNTVTLEDMNYFWMPTGAPCFIANNWDVVDDICETIESFGFQIYYLICDKSSRKTVSVKNEKGLLTSQEVYEYTPAILKVVNNFTGRVIMDSPDAFGNNFAAVEEIAQYTMPPIPKVIVDKLDEFFRLVDAQHHTESIVILTYDTTKQGSDGWGVLVPEQENTSVHCKYDADSIAVLKPDNVMIVGSVHSHPGMAAYASGTDHADQADFDGIHITYGWQNNVNNGATQYHIELQVSGESYILKPEDVFETYSIAKQPDPEVVEWSTKVKKALPLYTGGSVTQAAHPAPNQSYQTTWATQTHNSQPTVAGTTGTLKSFDKSKFLEDIKSVSPDSIIAIEIDSVIDPDADCIICGFPITINAMKQGFCITCDTPIISPEMGHFDILSSIHKYAVDRSLDPNVAYYVYCRDERNPSTAFLMNIKPVEVDPVSAGSDYGPDDEYDMFADKEPRTVCCDVPLSKANECYCPKTVTEEDIASFDAAHRDFEIYDNTTKCYDCQNYYDVSCPSFRKALVDYVQQNKILNNQIQECDFFVHYKDQTLPNEYIAESSERYSLYYD